MLDGVTKIVNKRVGRVKILYFYLDNQEDAQVCVFPVYEGFLVPINLESYGVRYHALTQIFTL